MDLADRRADMVDGLEQPPKAVLTDEAVIDAMAAVPRHHFVEDERVAYTDCASECYETRVLAPSTVARLFEALALEVGQTVLIVGAGVGYTAAVAAEIAGETNVHAIDIARPLVATARERLASAGYTGVLVDCRDGAQGLPQYAPFDRILLEAAAVDPPRRLRRQLTDDGRLVYPKGTGPQRIVAHTADGEEAFDAVAFDPLLVDGEQSGAMERNRTAREDRERAATRAESRRGWEHEWLSWDDRLENRPN